MKIISKTPQESLDKHLLRFRPKEPEFERFKKELSELLGKIDEAEREDNQEMHVHNFLRDGFYRGVSEINKRGTIDLAIHLTAEKTSPVGVIIETKRPGNKGEMLTVANPNTKAFQELVLYFMRERVDEENDDIRYLVATNINEWFIFSAQDFNRHFYDNKKFRKAYESWRDDLKVSSNTPHFYNEIAKPFIDDLDETLECTHFDLREYSGKVGERKLIALYKLLSPYHLLKRKFTDDGNTLDKRFYTELLHIIGLEEYKEKSKTLIRRKPNKSDGTLIEKAIAKLESEYFVFDQTNWKKYGEAKANQIYNAALELCIFWTNRVLFLKLLESQLVGYHDGEAAYKFLNKDKVNNFNELSRLFHDVLNCPVAERKTNVRERFPSVPYLNSSLFDFADVEIDTIRIHSIDDNGELSLPNTSILRKLGEKADSLPTLEYLFRFLDAYDFASEGKEEIQKENRSLINASVLGKVFEKINGYKDGSIYTPGFITMYMCRQAIRLAVVQKFKDESDFDGSDFDELTNWIKSRNYQKENIRDFNQVIDSLKICDPAVGSGHFLVSALNEILAIKSELGIFADSQSKTFGDHTIAIANDELIITDRQNNLFEYKVRDGRPLNDEMQRLQSTLFHEKQKLIENCLFGVDINPNSVKICRLRLWIELLKNAYYKSSPTGQEGWQPSSVDGVVDRIESESDPNKETRKFSEQTTPSAKRGHPSLAKEGSFESQLETLPNIDINIKEGNSLISRFGLQDKFKSEAANKIVREYRGYVSESKNVKDKQRKDELKLLVTNLRKALSSSLDDETTELKKSLDKKYARLSAVLHPKLDFAVLSEAEREIKTRVVRKEIEKVESDLAKVESKYADSFEWRFEFPEILDDDGNFLGFDAVIGNPPYVYRNYEYEGLKGYFDLNFQSTEGNFDLYKFFVEKSISICSPAGYISLIISNTFLTGKSFDKFRRLIFENTRVLEIFDLGEHVFEGITVENVLLLLRKGFSEDQIVRINVQRTRHESIADLESSHELDLTAIFKSENAFNIYLDEISNVLVKKIRQRTVELGKLAYCTVGINTGYIKAEMTARIQVDSTYHRMLSGRDIGVNSVDWKGEWIKYDKEFVDSFGDRGRTLPPEFIFTREKILVQRTRRGMKRKLVCYFDTEGFYNLNRLSNIIITDTRYSLRYIHAILNSKLMDNYFNTVFNEYEVKPWHLSQLPIKVITPQEQTPLIELVDKILELKKSGGDTTELENQIDKAVYALYKLTSEEIKLIEN